MIKINSICSRFFVASAAISVSILIGCAAVQPELRATKPIYEFSSAKTAKAVTVCVADSWESQIPTVSTRPTNNGYAVSVIAHDLQMLYYLADMEERGTGSATKFWAGTFTLEYGIKKFADMVKACQ